MKRAIATLTAGLSAAVSLILVAPNSSVAEVGWSHSYQCGQYAILLQEYALQAFSYRSESPRGNLNLRNGVRRNTGASWIYEFNNGNTQYAIEDAWDSPRHPGGFAQLLVYQNGRLILDQPCRKSPYAQSPPSNRPNRPSQPVPWTQANFRNPNEIAMQISEGEFNFSGLLRRGETSFTGSDGRVQVFFTPNDGHVTVVNAVTGTTFYDYYIDPLYFGEDPATMCNPAVEPC